MDDETDYEALFFAEARELLEELHDRLSLMAEGGADGEAVAAAFRAVHSVKGGAAAFGFETLTGFAHVFETVMDRVRGGGLAVDAATSAALMRAADVMQDLVEGAEAGNDADPAGFAASREELERLATTGASDTAPADAAAPGGEFVCRFTPGPDFFESGHDMLRLIRKARGLGLADCAPAGTVPPLAEFDPRICPIGWTLTFRPPPPQDDLDAFFEVYAHAAAMEFPLPEPDPDADKPAPTAAPAAAGASAKTLRVDIARVDRLVNLVGEILISQAGLSQRLADAGGRAEGALELPVAALARQIRELQDSVMAIRAQPVRGVFRRMERVVRDLAQNLGKDARLVTEGEDTEVDATVIEELVEPLTHMIRNAMDHGLESAEERVQQGKPREGVIRLSAAQRGERVHITVADDGRGIDRDRVLTRAVERGLVEPASLLPAEEIDALIFQAGFSTAETASAVSGRGVGMDVVRQKIHALGGRCAFDSAPGAGARFTLTLPLTLAVMDGMTVAAGGQCYVLPLSTVIEALRVPQGIADTLPGGRPLIDLRGELVPLLNLRDVLRLPPPARPAEVAVVVDGDTGGPVAVLVDELIGQRQIVLKSLEANYRRVDGVSGATILGDGQVALVLDIAALLRTAAGPSAAEVLM